MELGTYPCTQGVVAAQRVQGARTHTHALVHRSSGYTYTRADTSTCGGEGDSRRDYCNRVSFHYCLRAIVACSGYCLPARGLVGVMRHYCLLPTGPRGGGGGARPLPSARTRRAGPSLGSATAARRLVQPRVLRVWLLGTLVRREEPPPCFGTRVAGVPRVARRPDGRRSCTSTRVCTGRVRGPRI